MRITKINLSSTYNNNTTLTTKAVDSSKNINQVLCNKYRTNLPSYITPQIITSPTITFSGVTRGGNLLKKLAKFGAIDMYTAKPMLYSKILEKWQQTNLFSRPISEIIRVTRPYKNTLGKVETQVYSILEEAAKINPDKSLGKIINELVPQNEKKLISMQQPIFEELIKKACKMPHDRFNEFMNLMDITNKKIGRNPVLLPFSEREFRYKLTRISQEIESRNNREEVKAIKRLRNMANRLFYSKSPTMFYIIKNSQIRKYTKNQRTQQAITKNTKKLENLKNIVENSPLKVNKEIQDLLADASARIHGIATIVPFKRKPFIHDLEKITATLDDKNLAKEMQEIAAKLPQASKEISAFIVKLADNTDDKIGYKIFEEAVCSVDHLKPAKGGGASAIKNYGLCSKATNSDKSNTPFAQYIEQNPQARENIQKYIDNLIDLCNRRVFKRLGIKRSYIENFAYTVRHLTTNSNPIVLDTSRLK